MAGGAPTPPAMPYFPGGDLMPRIRILQAVGGLDFSWAAGDEIDVDADTAKAWLEGGERAELVRGETVETPESSARTEKTSKARSTRTTKSASDGS